MMESPVSTLYHALQKVRWTEAIKIRTKSVE
jgi:hypothetical protein